MDLKSTEKKSSLALVGSPKYVASLDGLRAVAVLAVVLNHLSEALLPLGYLGVDIFFVISGYVITASLMSNFEKKGNTSLILYEFYERRVKRLLPALLACVTVTTIVAMMFDKDAMRSSESGLFAIFGVSNLYFYFNSFDYYAALAELNFFTHTWSLGVEEQFYMVYPIFLMVMINMFGGGRLRHLPILFLSALVLLSAIAFVLLSESHPVATFYLLPFRFWEIGAGGMLFLVNRPGRFQAAHHSRAGYRVAFIFMMAAILVPAEAQSFNNVFVVVATLFVIYFVANLDEQDTILSSPLFVAIGLLSYSIYLWHWPILVFARLTVGITEDTIFVLLGLIVIVSCVSYFCIERPARYGRQLKNPKAVLIAAGLSSAGVAFLLFIALQELNGKLYLGSEALERSSFTESEIVSMKGDPLLYRSTMARKLGCNMTPHRANREAAKPIIDSNFVDRCLSSTEPKVVLVGDSFANAISFHVASIARDLGFEFRIIFGYGCPYPLEIQGEPHASTEMCEVEPKALRAAIARNINPGDVVVFRVFFQKKQYVDGQQALASNDYNAYTDELLKLAKITSDAAAKLVVVGTNWTSELCSMKQWYNRAQCPDAMAMGNGHLNRLAIQLNRTLQETVALHDGLSITFVDPIRIMCSAELEECPLVINNKNMLRDWSHLSPAGVDYLYEDLKKSISFGAVRNTGAEP